MCYSIDFISEGHSTGHSYLDLHKGRFPWDGIIPLDSLTSKSIIFVAQLTYENPRKVFFQKSVSTNQINHNI